MDTATGNKNNIIFPNPATIPVKLTVVVGFVSVFRLYGGSRGTDWDTAANDHVDHVRKRHVDYNGDNFRLPFVWREDIWPRKKNVEKVDDSSNETYFDFGRIQFTPPSPIHPPVDRLGQTLSV